MQYTIYEDFNMNICIVYIRVIAAVMLALAKSSAINIKSFQPAIIPIQSVTKLTIATVEQLNTSSSIQCRFNDISMPARLSNNLVFCETPPMRKTDKVVLHLEVDGKLYKAKIPLRFHEPFKVAGITPNLAFPSQQLHITISGITCQDWMTFRVRFQTANGTKRTQKGICVNSTVTCYVPEFPARTLLRVGVTLSNRIVEWSSTKLLVQYPVDSKKSLIKDLYPNIQKQGAFSFKVMLRDKFKNSLNIDKASDSGGFSVQYIPYKQKHTFLFPNCDVRMATEMQSSEFLVSCFGAKHERIEVYPLINNVVVGEKSSYEVKTTLCPGKTSCSEKPKDHVAAIVVSCMMVAVIVVLVAHRKSISQRINHWKSKRKSKAVDEDQCQHIQMVTSSSEPVSGTGKDTDGPFAYDNVLAQNIDHDHELNPLICDDSGVGVATDGVVNETGMETGPREQNSRSSTWRVDNPAFETEELSEMGPHGAADKYGSSSDRSVTEIDGLSRDHTEAEIEKQKERRESTKDGKMECSTEAVGRASVEHSYDNDMADSSEEELEVSFKKKLLLELKKEHSAKKVEDPSTETEGACGQSKGQQKFSYDMIGSSEEEAEKEELISTPIKRRLFLELKKRIKKYRRSKTEDNDDDER